MPNISNLMTKYADGTVSVYSGISRHKIDPKTNLPALPDGYYWEVRTSTIPSLKMHLVKTENFPKNRQWGNLTLPILWTRSITVGSRFINDNHGRHSAEDLLYAALMLAEEHSMDEDIPDADEHNSQFLGKYPPKSA